MPYYTRVNLIFFYSTFYCVKRYQPFVNFRQPSSLHLSGQIGWSRFHDQRDRRGVYGGEGLCARLYVRRVSDRHGGRGNATERVRCVYGKPFYHLINEFLISKIRIVDINNCILDIKNSNFGYQQLHFGYQEFAFLISTIAFWISTIRILDINNCILDIKNSHFGYQEWNSGYQQFEFLISRIEFWISTMYANDYHVGRSRQAT